MNSTLYLVNTPCRGGSQGIIFDDPLPVGEISTAAINRIVIRHGGLIDCLEVYYSWKNGEGSTHGGTGGGREELILEAGEFITTIEGRSTDTSIVRLTFVTNKRKWGPFGGTTGEYFKWGEAGGTPSSLPRMQLMCFNGSAGIVLYSLQATFVEYREHTSKTVRYESISAPTTPAQASVSVVAGMSPPLSEFAAHLMASVITLYVGENRIEFHVYEDTLCQLSFFRAALQGQFREALERTINMPEDYPSEVSALVEYLYTGNYTYTYNPKGVHFSEGSSIPIGDLAEGLFHVGVYSIASKYDCGGLVGVTVKNFEAVLNELDNLDTLRLWKAAYAEGLRLSGGKKDFEKYHSGEGLISWVKGLFKEHPDEMEKTMFEHPVLACDLLRVVTGDYSWG